MDKTWKHDKFQTEQRASQPISAGPGSYHRPSGQPVPAGDFYRPVAKPGPSNTATYIPQDTLILRKAARLGITAEQVNNVIDKFNVDVRLRHSNKVVNPQWLLWKEQSLTWNYLCEAVQSVDDILPWY